MQWQVTYTDGSTLSDQEAEWAALSHPLVYDGLTLHVLTGEASALSAYQGDCTYTLHAPEIGTRFYRHFRGRHALGTHISLVSHAIGYIYSKGRVLLEIDADGSTRRLFFPRV